MELPWLRGGRRGEVLRVWSHLAAPPSSCSPFSLAPGALHGASNHDYTLHMQSGDQQVCIFWEHEKCGSMRNAEAQPATPHPALRAPESESAF